MNFDLSAEVRLIFNAQINRQNAIQKIDKLAITDAPISVALYNYTAVVDNELSFNVGDEILKLSEKDPQGKYKDDCLYEVLLFNFETN